MTMAAGQPVQIVRSKSVAKFGEAGDALFTFGVPELERAQHADRERDRFGAGSQAGLLEAAEELRRKLDVVSHDERADAERAVEFVCGEGDRGDAQFAEIDGQLADDLSGVGVEWHAMCWRRSPRAPRWAGLRRFRCWRALR